MKKNPFATARKFLLMHDEQRLATIIKAIKSVQNPPRQHESFVNNLPDVDMDGPDDNALGDTEEMDRSPSHGESIAFSLPQQHIENSGIQYVQLPLPKTQGQNELHQDRQSGGRGGNRC
jgi:hypothetical protein